MPRHPHIWLESLRTHHRPTEKEHPCCWISGGISEIKGLCWNILSPFVPFCWQSEMETQLYYILAKAGVHGKNCLASSVNEYILKTVIISSPQNYCGLKLFKIWKFFLQIGLVTLLLLTKLDVGSFPAWRDPSASCDDFTCITNQSHV